MPSTTKSRLFAVTEFLVKAALFIYPVVIIGLVWGLVMVARAPDRVTVKLGPVAEIIAASSPYAASFAICGMIVLSALMLPVLIKLLAVVRSARAGNPFTRQNGAHLRAIGWLLLASYAIQCVISSVGFPATAWMMFVTAPWRGLAPVLLFFVVAHIFDQGAEMRADLEGTV